MLTHLRLLVTLISMIWETSPASDGDDDDAKPDASDVTFDDRQQAKVNALIAAERKDAEAKTAARLKADAETKAQRDREEAQRKKDEDAGEFAKVRTSLEQERDTVTAERDDLKAEHGALTSYFTAQYDAALKDLPDVVKAFAPAEDATFQQKSEWLTKAQDQARKLTKDRSPGFGTVPKPATREPDIDETAAVAQARRAIRI